VGEIGVSAVDRDALRRFIAEKYSEVATNPELGFHFHTGRPLALMLGSRSLTSAAAPDSTP